VYQAKTIVGTQLIRSLLRLQQVLDRTGLARSTLYKLISKQDFPAPIPLTGRAVAWDSQAVDSWIESRITAAA
jgi:prophage regulatory protein